VVYSVVFGSLSNESTGRPAKQAIKKMKMKGMVMRRSRKRRKQKK